MQAPKLEVYETFRHLISTGELEFGQIQSFFQEKIALETLYVEKAEKLMKKHSWMSAPNGKSVSETLAQYFKYCAMEAETRSKYKDQLIMISANLDELKQSLDTATKVLKETVKPVARRYTELASQTIPKMKANHLKKAQAFDKETSAFSTGSGGGSHPNTQGQKLYKLQREAELADQAYRSSIVELEECRLDLEIVKQKACGMWEVIERQRCQSLQLNLTSLSKTLSSFQNVSVQRLESFAASAGLINQHVDCKISMDYFMLAFPEREPILYENHKTKLPVKDMVFGVDFGFALRQSMNSTLPHVLKYCFEAIEARGLDKEGIYRVSAKKGDLVDLRAKVEYDVHSINFMDESLDIHLLTGLVKSYLRELPRPIFWFPAKERIDYSNTLSEDDRLLILANKLSSLSRDRQIALKAILDHLKKVTDLDEKNKMSVANISMIFSAILFESQEPSVSAEPTTLAEFASNWFQSKTNTSQQDMNTMELYKMDLVMQDLMNCTSQLFDGSCDKVSIMTRSSGGRRKSTQSIEQRRLPMAVNDSKHASRSSVSSSHVSSSSIHRPVQPVPPVPGNGGNGGNGGGGGGSGSVLIPSRKASLNFVDKDSKSGR